MNAKDRERLAVSTGIALAGYAVLFLLLAGLRWPPVVPLESISPPVSVYVNLRGSPPQAALPTEAHSVQTAPLTRTAQPLPESPATASPPQPTAEAPAAQASQAAQAPAQVAAVPQQSPTMAAPIRRYAEATPIPQAPSSQRASTMARSGLPPQSQAAISNSSSSTGLSASGQSSQQPTASAGVTSTGQPYPAGGFPAASAEGSASGSSPLAGPVSPNPGVNYAPSSEATAQPAGSGGAGASQITGQSKTYYGAPSSPGQFINPQLLQSAGNGSASSSAAGQTGGGGAESSSGASQGAGAAGTSVGSAGAGGSVGAGGQPKILWEESSATRQVAYEPSALVIPPKLLSEIPPTIRLTINFQVMPSGTVNALNVTPSLGYPQLDTLLENWMEEWRFQSIGGGQIAQGKLEYVIQAVTAR